MAGGGRKLWGALAVAGSLMLGGVAQAATVSWTQWNNGFTPNVSATGTVGGVGVGYDGSFFDIQFNNPSWGPAGTYTGGGVDNAPTTAGGMIALTGGTPRLNSITFGSAVVDPLIAIWSAGQPGVPVRFIFDNATPTFVSGGPNAEFNGSAITVLGNTVTGVEGNGIVRLVGTFTHLDFVTPDAEGYYGFTVGITSVASLDGVPEPMTWALMVLGLGAVGGFLRAQRRTPDAELA